MAPSYVVPGLVGRYVRLEPLDATFIPELYEAANEDRSTYGLTRVPETRAEVAADVERLLEEYEHDLSIPFAQVDVARQRAVGVTRFLTLRCVDARSDPYAVEIGGTWLASSAQRTPINTEAKLLLLDYAFSTWRCTRVDLKTDVRNLRSREAIARIGATFEGVLRHWQPSLAPNDASAYRDTAMYSILDSEWPRVGSALRERLG